jgi:hypothetical protein
MTIDIKTSVQWAIKVWEKIPPKVRAKGTSLAKEVFSAVFKKNFKEIASKKKGK